MSDPIYLSENITHQVLLKLIEIMLHSINSERDDTGVKKLSQTTAAIKDVVMRPFKYLYICGE